MSTPDAFEPLGMVGASIRDEEEDDGDPTANAEPANMDAVEKMLKDPHSPACKLLRDLGLTPNDAKELNLLEVLRGLPRKERSKYVKRNSLSVEERAELKKKRNREHARDTRKRKKVIMEALQAQVSGLRERLDVPWGAGGTMSVHQGRCTVVEQFFQLLTALASSQDAVAAATMGLRALTSSDFQFTWPALPQHETFIKVEGSQRGEAGGGEGEYANLASQACVAKGVDDVLVEVTGFPARLAGLLEKAKNIAQEDNRDIMVSFGAIVRGSLDFSSISGVGVEEGDVHRCADSCADSCAGGDQIVGKRRTFVGTESESGHWANTRTWERVGADDCERSKEDSGSLVDPPLQPILSSGNTLFCGCEIKCALGRARGEPLRLTRVGGMAKCVFTQAREGTRVDAEEEGGEGAREWGVSKSPGGGEGGPQLKEVDVRFDMLELCRQLECAIGGKILDPARTCRGDG